MNKEGEAWLLKKHKNKQLNDHDISIVVLPDSTLHWLSREL